MGDDIRSPEPVKKTNIHSPEPVKKNNIRSPEPVKKNNIRSPEPVKKKEEYYNKTLTTSSRRSSDIYDKDEILKKSQRGSVHPDEIKKGDCKDNDITRKRYRRDNVQYEEKDDNRKKSHRRSERCNEDEEDEEDEDDDRYKKLRRNED